MNFKIWENTILAWVNSLTSGTPVTKINDLNEEVLNGIIRKFKFDFQNPIDFLKINFPNLLVPDASKLSTNCDYLSVATCLLIYVSFSKRTELEVLRENMCKTLDNFTQQRIARFLMSIGNHENVFQLSLNSIKKEILDFIEGHDSDTSMIGDCLGTPVTKSSNCSYDSPLQGVFQTPKRSHENRHSKVLSLMCGDGDHLKHLKQLSDQLVEEEIEKSSLQEKLDANIQKCNELEVKLKDKIEELKQLKYEWESESKKNEEEMLLLKNTIKKKFDDEEKLKSDISHLESCVSSLESDLADSVSETVKLEHQLKSSLEKYATCESQIEEIVALNMKLQEDLNTKEKELGQLREEFHSIYKNEKTFDKSFGEKSFDLSMLVPESMEVVVEKMLKDKIEENALLKEFIEELQMGKTDLLNELEKINKELVEKNSSILELQYLNAELSAKIEKFDTTHKELNQMQSQLISANATINNLLKENSQLNEKCTSLNYKTEEQEKAIMNFKNSKVLLSFDFFKFAQDFKSVQQRLETEVSNITKLISDNQQNHSQIKEKKEINGGVEFQETTFSDQTFNISKAVEGSIAIGNPEFTANKKLENIEQLLHYFDGYDLDWSLSKTSIQKAHSQANDNIITLKLKVMELEKNQKDSLDEKLRLEKCLLSAEKKISEMQQLYMIEIEKLNLDLKEKQSKITELEGVISKLKENQFNSLATNQVSKSKKESRVSFVFEGGDFTKTSSALVETEVSPSAIKKLPQEKEDPDDSLEVSICSKTFNIVDVENQNVSEKTFSIAKEIDSVQKKDKSGTSWFVSPPSKIPAKTILKRDKKNWNGENWVISLSPVKEQISQRISFSANDLMKAESSSNLTKSSSLSSILEVNSSPSKIGSKESGATSFFSVTDLIGTLTSYDCDHSTNLRKAYSSEIYLKNLKSENSLGQVFRLVERRENPLGEIFKEDLKENDKNKKPEWEKNFSQMRKEILELSKECERLRSALSESEQKRKKEKESFEINRNAIAQNITTKYETQLDHLKSEMKQLYNRELAKHKSEQSKLNSELREQNKRYKEHIDQLRNQLWILGENLLQEQKSKRDLERINSDLKKKFESMLWKDTAISKDFQGGDANHHVNPSREKNQVGGFRQMPNVSFPTIPTEDEEEVFDNRFLEDMKRGCFPGENPEERLLELQNRNTLCLPHLKSSYPGETQIHNPSLFKESDLKLGLLQFGQESQSLTDSDHSMTRSLIPENKGKKKDQTSYKKPGPPTPSKHGGRLSMQNGDLRMTPRNVLRELNDQNERNRGSPIRLKSFLPMKNGKRESLGGRDENSVPVTPRKKLGKIFRKPFGARDH